MNEAFEREVVTPVRAHLGRGVRLPAIGSWHLGREGGAPVMRLTLPHEVLGENLQKHHPAAPFFLVCFAWWHARITGTDPALELVLSGDAPTDAPSVRHLRRARIALEALSEALGDRLEIVGLHGETWPTAPVLNAPRVTRGSAIGGKGPEHRVEVQLTDSPDHAATLPSPLPIGAFRRQLPLGLFEGEVSNDARWTPGHGAQADLWAASPDGSVFHLFELKVGRNATVGILPELLVYLWLVHQARLGRIAGGGPGIEAARRADRLVGWTLAPRLHPLLGDADATPLSWLAEGLVGSLDLGMLFYDEVDGMRPFGGWRPGRTWTSWTP